MESKKRQIVAPKVSIIIPCYNIALYVAECLESVTGQTLRELEIIVIDDCSYDNAIEIVQKYAANDNRIRVLSLQKNSGVSAARNAGMAIATGEFIGFVDGDDYIDLDFYEKLYAKAVEEKADITAASWRKVLLNGEAQLFEPTAKNMETPRHFLFRWGFYASLYKRSFLHNNSISFSETMAFAEDTLFNLCCAARVKKIAIVDNTVYQYIKRTGSITTEGLTPKKVASFCEYCAQSVAILNEHNFPQKEYISIATTIFNRCIVLLHQTEDKESHQQLSSAIANFYRNSRYKKQITEALPDLGQHLTSNDPEALCNILLAPPKKIIRFRLFGRFTLFWCEEDPQKGMRITLFGKTLLIVGS